MLILVGSEKGGTGKTTVAVNLATLCALAGHDTLLVDTDKQESATIWASLRSEREGTTPVPCVSKTGKVGYDLAKLKPKFARIIVDAGGRDSLELRQTMAICDRMIIPVRPSQFDTWSLDRMLQLIRDIEERTGEKVDARLLMNAVSPNPSVTEAVEFREALKDYGEELPIMKGQIAERIAFRRAAREGLSVVELSGKLTPSDREAANEISAVYKEAFNETWRLAKPAST